MGLVLFECPACGMVIKNRRSMGYHLRKYHPNLKMRDVKRISSRTYEYIETKVKDKD